MLFSLFFSFFRRTLFSKSIESTRKSLEFDRRRLCRLGSVPLRIAVSVHSISGLPTNLVACVVRSKFNRIVSSFFFATKITILFCLCFIADHPLIIASTPTKVLIFPTRTTLLFARKRITFR